MVLELALPYGAGLLRQLKLAYMHALVMKLCRIMLH